MGNVLGYSLVPIVAQPPGTGPGPPPRACCPVRLGWGGRTRTHASRIDSGASPIEMPPPASPRGRPSRFALLVSAASVAFRWTTRGALSGSNAKPPSLRWPVSSCNPLSTSSRAVLASALSLNSGISRRASSAACISCCSRWAAPLGRIAAKALVVRRHEGSGLPSLSPARMSRLASNHLDDRSESIPGQRKRGWRPGEITRRQVG
jgi:hypothetical protein